MTIKQTTNRLYNKLRYDRKFPRKEKKRVKKALRKFVTDAYFLDFDTVWLPLRTGDRTVYYNTGERIEKEYQLNK